jgi:D-alanyl-D-alanine dipeptidase
MRAESRLYGVDAVILSLGLWLLTCSTATAAPPAQPPARLRLVVGEYRSADQTLTLYEKDGKLYAGSGSTIGDSLHAVGRDRYRAADGQRLEIRHRGREPLTVEWHGAVFDRYDLGAERVSSIRARVHADAQTLRAAALAAQPPAEPTKPRRFDLVPLLGTVPHVKLDIKYATPDNFIGLPLYGSMGAYLQRPAAAALSAVARSLAVQGLGIVIFDGYRPWFVTKMFWDAVPPEAHVFVADPREGSKHNRGCAVDLSLYDLKTGRSIEMTGRYDEMSQRSYANYVGGTSRERWFRDLLRREMQARGFQVYPEEWWHFDYRDWDQYPIGNQAFENLDVTTKE